MDEIYGINNRELAGLIWFSIITVPVVIFLLLTGLLKTLLGIVVEFVFNRTILPLVVAAISYIIMIFLIFSYFEIVDISFLPKTILWILTTGIALWFKSTNISEDWREFPRLITGIINLSLVFEIILDSLVFSLLIEILLIPLIAFMYVISRLKLPPKIINKTQMAIGTAVIFYCVFIVICEFEQVMTIDNIYMPLLTITFLPFVYGLSLFISYHKIFHSLDSLYMTKHDVLRKTMKRRIVTNVGLNLKKLNWFTDKDRLISFLYIKNESDLDQVFRDFREAHTRST